MVHSNQSLFTEQKWYLVSPAANGQWSDVVAGWAAAGATAASSATFYKFIYKLHEPVTNGVSLSQNSWDQIDITGTHDDLEENVGYFVYVETAGTEVVVPAGPNNLVLSTAVSTLVPGYVVNKLSWAFPSSDITSEHDKLLTTLLTTQGSLSTYRDNNSANAAVPPNPAFFGFVPAMEDTTFLSTGMTPTDNGDQGVTASFLMEDGSAVPSPLVLDSITGVVWYGTGITLTADEEVQMAQITLSTTSNGTITMQYGSEASGSIYQQHTLIVTNGVITMA